MLQPPPDTSAPSLRQPCHVVSAPLSVGATFFVLLMSDDHQAHEQYLSHAVSARAEARAPPLPRQPTTFRAARRAYPRPTFATRRAPRATGARDAMLPEFCARRYVVAPLRLSVHAQLVARLRTTEIHSSCENIRNTLKRLYPLFSATFVSIYATDAPL